MSYDTILYGVEAGVATITLNRPDRLNAWTATMDREVREAMTRAGGDEDVRVIVLTGAGRGFCAGADMDTLSGIQTSGGDRPAPQPVVVPWTSSAPADFRMTHAYFPTVPKPIVAAINGPCAGIGLVHALYCDLRFAAQSAVFTTAFAARGLIAEHGISWLLPRLVGPAHALDLLLSARKIRGEEAAQIGLVNRAIPDPEFRAEVAAYARHLASSVSPRSMAIMKRQVWQALHQGLAEATVVADREMEASFASEDFREGVAHFVEKRPPAFSGR